MKITFKTFTIAAACALPITGYAGYDRMTLPELKAFPEGLRTEGLKNLEPFREKIEKTKQTFPGELIRCVEDFSGEWYKELPGDSEREKKDKRERLATFKREHKEIPGEPNTYLRLYSTEAEKARKDAWDALFKITHVGKHPSTVTKIDYNTDGEPISIEAVSDHPFTIKQRLNDLSSPFRSYIIGKRDPQKTRERIGNLSKELTEKDLEQRNVNVETLKTLGIKNVREITFASVLESNFFTGEQKKKAGKWFNCKEELEKALEAYAETYPWIQKTVECTFKSTEIANEHKPDWENQTVTFIDKVTPYPIHLSYSVLKHEGETSEIQEKIATSLKSLLRYKNGKEKVILLLLLDENTPEEHRLRWIHEEDGEYAEGAYDHWDNALHFNFNEDVKSLSHEIGHYLQTHLGLYQTFDDYQTLFAKKLLQLENKQTNEPITISNFVKDDIGFGSSPVFWGLKELCFKCPKQLPMKKFFEYYQLVERWHSVMEVSDILGVYFNDGTLYINALSDIRELKRIRYTHNYKPNKERLEINKNDFTQKDRELFEKIVEEAFSKPIPTEELGLLCQLHQRSSFDAKNAVCDFELANCSEEWNKRVEPLIFDFIEAE